MRHEVPELLGFELAARQSEVVHPYAEPGVLLPRGRTQTPGLLAKVERAARLHALRMLLEHFSAAEHAQDARGDEHRGDERGWKARAGPPRERQDGERKQPGGHARAAGRHDK